MDRKDAVKNEKNVNEMIFYLKNQYLPHNEEQGTFIENIKSRRPAFEKLDLKQYLIPEKFFKINKRSRKHELEK